MFSRHIESAIKKQALKIPIIALLGPKRSGKTIVSDFFKGLDFWRNLTGNPTEPGYIIYGGEKNQPRSKGTVVSWKNMDDVFK